MTIRTLAATAAALALLALTAASAPAATPATPYDASRIPSFEPQDGGRFADRMASAGDLNGDGVGDVWISAYSHDVGGLLNVGRVWAMSGATRTPLYEIDHPEPQNCMGFACGLGWSISNLGDIDGDGINDLVAGANRQNVTAAGVSCTAGTDGCNRSQGKAYVFSGARGNLLYDLDNPEPQANAYFGWASNAGDIVRADGTPGQDGIAEVLVGAFQNDFALADTPAAAVGPGCGNRDPIPVGCRKDQGQSFIFNGAPGVPDGQRLVRTLNIPPSDRYVDPATDTCVSPDVTNPRTGVTAYPGPTGQICGGAGIVNEGVGDVDNDGFWDQSVTAWTTGVSRTNPGQACYGDPAVGTEPEGTSDDCNERQGRIHIYSGRTGGLLRTVDNPVPQQGALFGLQIVQAGAPGDINGDGHDDIYGNGFQQSGPARGDQPPLRQEGRSWVFSGRDGSVLLSLLDPTPEANGTFGYSLEKTDYNRDGIPDLYVGSFAGSYVFLSNGALQKVFDLPASERDPAQPAGNTNLGRSVAAPGDLNGDCEPDYLAGSPGSYVDGVANVGRAYLYASNTPSACPRAAPPAPPAPPGTPPATPPPAAQPGLFTAKLAIARARILRRERRVDVLAPITSLASGRARVELHAANRRYRFTAPINSRDGRIRFSQRIPKAQADLGTGILTITYLGDADTRPQTVRLRAASQQAKLRLERPTISNGRLRASGTVSKRARGVVRVQVQYVVRGESYMREFKARISNGRWSLNERLTQTVRTAIAQRTGTVHSYTLFTGYYERRIRGEMRSFQVLGPR